jgi:60 kDa SS-A/Ro ribonucleoprotein
LTSPLRGINTRSMPQTQRVDARQVRNDSGGYSFQVDRLDRLKRFLVLGVDSGTANLSARELARQNAGVVEELIQDHAPHELADQLIDTIVDFSVNNRAPRQQPGLFALAMAASLGDRRIRARALAVLPQVARTGTTLFEFIQFSQQFRGWGRGLRRAVRNWYVEKGVAGAAFQAVKYRQRAGYSHRDLLRLSHPKVDGDMNLLFRWVVGKPLDREFGRLVMSEDDPLAIVETFERLQRATTVRQVTDLIADGDVTWEMIPDRFINDLSVWHALFERNRIGATALMRQLPRLTRIGMLTPMGNVTPLVAARLQDAERLRRGRVHPFNVLLAQRTYASGHSDRGRSTWEPVRQVTDALDAAFYASYGNVEPTGKRLMLSLDVSGTMTTRILNSPLQCREAASALALITAATEDRYEVNAFTGSLTPLNISPRQRLDDVMRRTRHLPFGRTDCALPMLTAAASRTEVDTFVIYTDSETNQNSVHPHVALQRYRDQMGIDARLVVVAMTSTGFTIAHPDDPGMLDLVGFDGSLPNLVSGFARGEF